MAGGSKGSVGVSRRAVWLVGIASLALVCLLAAAYGLRAVPQTAAPAQSVAYHKPDSQELVREEAQDSGSTERKDSAGQQGGEPQNTFANGDVSVAQQTTDANPQGTNPQGGAPQDVVPSNNVQEPQIIASNGERVDDSVEPQIFKLPAEADYVADVVLVSVDKGISPQELSDQLSVAGVRSIDPSSARRITDDLMELGVVAGSSVEEAVNELLATRVVQDAQPDYLYELNTDEALLEADSEGEVQQDEALQSGESLGIVAQDDGPQDTAAHNVDPEELDVQAEDPITLVESEPGQDPEQDPDDEPEGEELPPAGDSADSSEGSAPNDPYYPWQWALQSMNVPQAWRTLGASPNVVGVAVLDAGVDTNHEDLKNMIPQDAPYNAFRASQGNADPDQLRDVLAGPTQYDHGTHVAGIIAAQANNGVGLAGVAPNVQLIPIRCYSYDEKPQAPTSALVKGMEYVIEHQDDYNIRVVNCSMGIKVDPLPVDNSFLKKVDEAFAHGIITVASAGNKSSSSAPFVNFPGEYDTCVSVINLANNTLSTDYRTDGDGASSLYNVLFKDAWDVCRNPGSNYNAAGKMTKDISAPGTQIISSADHLERILGCDEPYMLLDGTSMSAPQVSGVLALMHGKSEVSKDASGAGRMVDVLYSSARSLGSTPGVFDEQTGYGEVDAVAALELLDAKYLVGPSYVKAGQQDVGFLVEDKDGDAQEGWQFSSSAPNVLSIDATTGACVVERAGSAEISATDGVKRLVTNVVVVGDIEGYDVVTTEGVAKYAVQSPTALAWEWTSSNNEVASVSSSGYLRAGKDAGRVTITATLLVTKGTLGELSVSKEVTVAGPLSGPSAILAGDTASLVVEGPEDWEFRPEDFVWASKDNSIATVNKQGVVTGVCGGFTTIWACPQEACTSYVDDDGRTHLQFGIYLEFALSVQDKIDRDEVHVSMPGTQTYTGSALTPVPQLSLGSKVLQEGTDYSLSYKNNVHAGTASVLITGVGAFDGSSRTQTFAISPAPIADVQVASISNKAYTGKAIAPKPKVTWNGMTLKQTHDYTLLYKNNVYGGTATITIAGTGDFKGTKKVTFKIVEPSVVYRSFVLGNGWRPWVKNGKATGKTTKGKFVTGLKAKLTNAPYTGGIRYRVHLQKTGWQAWKTSAALSGQTKTSKRAEAIRITLTGKMAKYYSVRYRAKVQGVGWTPWVSDGKTAGTTGQSLRMYAIQIKIVPK